MNDEFVYSSKFVGIDCAILKSFQICRNGKLLHWDCFCNGKINIFIVDIQSQLCWSCIDVLGDDADGSYFNLRQKWNDDECLAIALGSNEFLFLKPTLIFSEKSSSIFCMLFVKASHLISINGSQQIICILNSQIIFASAVWPMNVLHPQLIMICLLATIDSYTKCKNNQPK